MPSPEDIRERIERAIPGARAEVDYHWRYPPLVNHAEPTRFARQVVRDLLEHKTTLRTQSRAQLFPQVLRIVKAYIANKIDNPAQVDLREIGLDTYAKRIVSLLHTAIEPDIVSGEAPILPLLNRYKPIGSSGDVHFKTVKPIQATTHSHLNFVACDTHSWEQATMTQLEILANQGVVSCYVRNDHLEFTIPYEYYGYEQQYEPDFIVRLRSDWHLVLETKGQARQDTDAKHEAAKRWVKAVNHWGKLGQWSFLVCWNPQELGVKIRELISNTQ